MGNEISSQIKRRLQKIRPLIPPNVRLVAVTKTFPAAVVRAAYAAGIREFAENKAQEALAKQAELSDLTDVVWHFIGHVQSNKSRKVVEHFDWIHSVDSLKLAARLDRQAAELGKRPSCCLQVKLALDPTKDGFERDELMAALADLNALTNLNIVGLMVIAPYGLPAEETQAIFAAGQALAAEIKRVAREQGLSRIGMEELSMGMSGDFEWAIAQGATLVRLGSSLFGSRQMKPPKLLP
ncbi:MAG: YggS family pyridoxal phosphate-dependent enzyme [Phormidesmis sp.]